MRIAIISDIHGNMEALESVFNDIESQKCEKIFVLGDYAMAGPEPSKVIDFFFQKQFDDRYTMIQGNTDYMIANYNEDLYNLIKEKAPVMAEALKSDVGLINFVYKDFLKNLPDKKEITIDGVKLLLVHGSPRKNNEDILPDTPMATINEMLTDIDANVILCGHTHIPCGFQTEKKQTVINVGSIGRPFTNEPKSCYLKLTIEKGKCLFEHRFVEYNNNIASEKLSKREFQGADKLAKTLLFPLERHF